MSRICKGVKRRDSKTAGKKKNLPTEFVNVTWAAFLAGGGAQIEQKCPLLLTCVYIAIYSLF